MVLFAALYVYDIFPLHPEPSSLHVPVIVLVPLVQELLPPLTVHFGGVVSTRTTAVAGQVVSFPTLSFTIPGDTLPFVSVVTVFETFPTQPDPSSLQVP